MEIPIERAHVFAEGLDHPEGLAVHPDGSVWAGGEAGQVYRISPDGKEVREVANTGGFNLGIAFSPGAQWLAICDLGNKCIWKLALPSMELSVFARGAEDHQFNIPNYAVFDKQGNLYVSESGAFREIMGKILKFRNDGAGQVWHNGPFDFANGMALAPDASYLYIVSSFLPGVERVAILPDGRAGDREVYCTLPRTVPDGLAFDEGGNLYVSCYTPNAIYRVQPDRTSSVFIDNWDAHTLSNPTNIAFGGPNFDQLFTSNLGRWHITRIDAGVRGSLLASHIRAAKTS
jgi:gluconolactonase